ncbi:hypothetical protein PG993_013035 [Apiospora rasikravindrae]|uniref:Uncharacterized protein n=1 Tax=Apiospora rasikravindrae TaxID=990691 RepID=A0ABR1RWX7_9PEZI
MIAFRLLLWGLGVQTLWASPSQDPDMDLTEEIMQFLLGPKNEGIRGHIREDALARGNTPASRPRLVANEETIEFGDTLWIANDFPEVDRILEPQTIIHFFEFTWNGRLPSGKYTELPLLGDDMELVTEPYSEWAPAPFDKHPEPAAVEIMARIGSGDDSARLQIVSKDLHAMKSRLWEGIMPLSQRRLEEQGANDLRNFTYTSQLITQLINVFHYLNEPDVRYALRDTYNLIYDHLETFEKAFNAKRAQESLPSVSVTALWAEYMRSHYEVMENRAHTWVLEILRPLKKKVLAVLRGHQPDQLMEADYDEIQWKLTNMWQDLSENTAHADWGIFMPMDGYKGCTSPSATPRNITTKKNLAPDGTEPIAFSPDPDRRMREYHLRRRHIDLMASIQDVMKDVMMDSFIKEVIGDPGSPEERHFNDPEGFGPHMIMQAKAQAAARKELRGQSITYETEPWLEHVIQKSGWGYVIYKTSQATSDAQWSQFTKKFEADTSNWGQGVANITVRSPSKMHWIDGSDVGKVNPSLDDLKSHFTTYIESVSFPENCFSDVFLVADEASVASYLNTAPQASIPRGDIGPFIYAVDAFFDPNDPTFRADESPFYDGTLRVLGSLIWDDVGALLLTQTQGLAELWPLAMEHPLEVYVGPTVQVQTDAWKRVRKADRQALEKWIKLVRDDAKHIRDEL